jgi:hypothetical protein
MTRLLTVAATWLTLTASAAVAAAQGVQTGTLRGKVLDSQNLAVPGVAVTITSPALQGARETRTAGDGAFIFIALPPGDYTVQFDLAGFGSESLTDMVPLGGALDVTVTLRPAAVAETVRVVAPDRPDSGTSVGLNIRQEEVEAIATSRTLTGIATLSPNVTENAPNSGQIIISGSFGYDNVFMVNGVDVNDNIFGNAQSLFIEDAIAETQVLTSGITAEYGRFSGGVVNAITKSGGNTMAGSYRLNLTNPAWTSETPFERDNDIDREGDLNLVHEGTWGGPLVQNRLWFFAAGRMASVASTETLDLTGVAFDAENINRRGEIKLTGTVAPGHTLQGGYLNNFSESENRPPLAFSIDPATLISDSRSNWYAFTNYRGVLSDTLLAEAQYTERRFRFNDSGGTDTALVNSPMIDFYQGLYQYNAPFFDATDPEERNNRQFTASVTKFLQGAGRHEFKGGYEFFRSQLTGGNSQSSTGYVFYSPLLLDDDGVPEEDEDGRLIPIFVPGVSEFDIVLAEKGAQLNTDTQSFFIQNHWIINSHVTADLGLRYERVRSEATGGIVGVDTDTVVPRLGLTVDPKGDGTLVFTTTYGHYSGRYNDALIGSNTTVGHPSRLFGVYVGPQGLGRGFAPGFDPDNYIVYDGEFPTANVVFEDNLSSPVTKEFTVGAMGTVGDRGFLSATYQYRTMGDVIEDFIDQDSGFTEIDVDGEVFGPFTNRVYRNTDIGERQYQALVFDGRFTLAPNWSVNGAWTIQLENDGNVEGEVANSPGATGIIGDFPEAFTAERHYPTGKLANFQRHRARIWTIYDIDLGRGGDLSIGGLVRIDSARAFSTVASSVGLSDTQMAALAGYPEGQDEFFLFGYTQDLFFGERGTGRFDGSTLVDVSVNHSLPFWRQLRPWIKLDFFNVFNSQPTIGFDTTVAPNPTSPVDDLGLPTGFVEGPKFGEATSVDHFPGGRAFRMAFGIRF